MRKNYKLVDCIAIAITFSILLPSFTSLSLYIPSAKAQEKNIVHFVTPNEWATINPFLDRTAIDLTVIGLIYEPLVIVKPDGEAIPWLATKWEAASDGKKITFYLNETAKWADGKPVTANDVKFTWDTMLKYGLVIFFSPSLIESVEVVNDHTVTFNLTEPYSPYLIGIAQVPIVPKHVWEKISDPDKFDNTDPVNAYGSGPMKFKIWRVGEYVELETNNNYWKKKILIDGVVVDLYKVPELGLLALKKGEADSSGVAYEAVPSMLDTENIEIRKISNPTSFRFIGLNLRIYPNNVKEFRKAINLAVDKKRILAQIDYGYGEICFEGYIPESLSYWSNPNCEWPGLNMTDEERIAEANSMLDKIGFIPGSDGIRVTSNGTRLELSFKIFAGYSNFDRVAEMVKSDCEKIGVKVNIEPIETMTLVNLVYGGKNPLDWQWLPAAVGYSADPDFMTAEWGHDPPDSWWCGDAYAYFNDELTKTLQAARRELNTEKRKELYLKAQEIFAEDTPVIMLENLDGVEAFRTDKFTGWLPEAGVGYPSLSVLGCESLPSVINLRPIKSTGELPLQRTFIDIYGQWIAVAVIIAIIAAVVVMYTFRKR